MMHGIARESHVAMSYEEFIAAKQATAPANGFVNERELHSVLKPHQRDMVQWALKRGRAALFASFGLGKTVVQLEIARQVCAQTRGRFLIVAPLGVRGEFLRDAAMLGMEIKFVRSIDECGETGVYLTNYESVRDGKIDPRAFVGAALDEASILRGFGGTKTFREFMRYFEHSGIQFRFVATATPSPNDTEELLCYSAFLEIADVSVSKTRFFERNATKADDLTLRPGKEEEFWQWVASWALFVATPSDLGYSDEGYALPPLHTHWVQVSSNHKAAGWEKDGKQAKLINDAAVSVQSAAKEKRTSMTTRVAACKEILAQYPDQQIVLWCDLNDEQKALEVALKELGLSFSSLYGNQSLDERERLMHQWRNRDTQVFLSKPMMYGAGVNLQQSHVMVFAGIGFKAQDFMQAIHRIHRFLQTAPCHVHIVYTDAEQSVRKILEGKWAEHRALVARMTELIRKHGLRLDVLRAGTTRRASSVTRIVETTEHCVMVLNDCVLETSTMESNSIHLIMTSIPFSFQYEYCGSYLDFGHTDSDQHFWKQMGYLIPELLRILKPGRIAAIHVKDRIVPGELTGLGFQTVSPFHADCIAEFKRHGFGYMGMKTIVTDVVRENNQTYRLAYTEQCKDGTKMGVGMPEYLLLFRKPPTDRSNGYADDPVVKPKAEYSLGRWQIDAHGFARSSGDRLLCAADFQGATHQQMFRMFKKYSRESVYDYERHVALNDALGASGQLPTTFMLLQPQSSHPDVWADVVRMRTLNTVQASKGKEKHICPLPLDIVNRAIVQHSEKGEAVFDPFAGLGTVPLCALKLGRRGMGVELNPGSFADSLWHVRQAELQMNTPTLFDLLRVEADADDEAFATDDSSETAVAS